MFIRKRRSFSNINEGKKKKAPVKQGKERDPWV
jgi:hypothetical protein